MTSDKKSTRNARKRDWRIWLGIIVTIVWLGGGAFYVLSVLSDPSFERLAPEAIGSFLEGAFAPLAFLWLVIGMFIQQKELANNSKAIRKASKQSEKQTAAIAATEMNARQETFFKIRENVHHQLGGITGMLYTSSMGPAGNGAMTREDMDANFKRIGDGDCEVFARLFLSGSFLEGVDLSEMFYGTDIRKRHTSNYMHSFARLRRLGQNCDIDGIIDDSLMLTAFGLLYQRMREYQPDAIDSGSVDKSSIDNGRATVEAAG